MLVNPESVVSPKPNPNKLLKQVRDELRLRRYSLRTESGVPVAPGGGASRAAATLRVSLGL
jgi:hypothetical protein